MLSSYIRDTRRQDSRVSFHRVPSNCSQNEACYCSNGLVNYILFAYVHSPFVLSCTNIQCSKYKHVRRRYECGVRNDYIFFRKFSSFSKNIKSDLLEEIVSAKRFYREKKSRARKRGEKTGLDSTYFHVRFVEQKFVDLIA